MKTYTLIKSEIKMLDREFRTELTDHSGKPITFKRSKERLNKIWASIATRCRCKVDSIQPHPSGDNRKFVAEPLDGENGHPVMNNLP